jgi:vesicle-fusing ATPase
MSELNLRVCKLESKSYAYKNHAYLNKSDFKTLKLSPSPSGTGEIYYAIIKTLSNECVFNISTASEVEPGQIGFNSIHRIWLNVSFNEAITVRPFNINSKDYLFMSAICLRVSYLKKNKKDMLKLKVQYVEELVKTNFMDYFFNESQELLVDVGGNNIILSVVSLSAVTLENLTSGNFENTTRKRGILTNQTSVTFDQENDSPIIIEGSNRSKLFSPDFNFEQLGIGGLDKEFSDIFRRAFASRVFPSEMIQGLGVKHVKGMLLHGPPGTGKTLIARQIGKMLNAREPKIVNGPEILNKFVGQSEENIRLLFAEAELEYEEKGEDSQLHIIIFDELDAICKARGSGSTGGTGVGDSVVNQLLSKLDGVNQINNILVIGMTNRPDLIDEALLRSGRLEVHVEIGLPDEKGRIQILNIHTSKMRSNGYLDNDVSIEELATLTRNFTGAEIEGLVRSATSFALNRQIDPKNPTKPIEPEKVKVTMEDFFNALEEVKPAFGASEGKLEENIKNGIIPFSSNFSKLYTTGLEFIDQVKNSTRTPILSFLLCGDHGTGKTALACELAKSGEFPLIKILAPEDFVGYSEQSKVQKITKFFMMLINHLSAVL